MWRSSGSSPSLLCMAELLVQSLRIPSLELKMDQKIKCFAFRLSSLFSTMEQSSALYTSEPNPSVHLSLQLAITHGQDPEILNPDTRPRRSTPPFSGWEPWQRIWRSRLSVSNPATNWGHGSKRLTEPHHLQEVPVKSMTLWCKVLKTHKFLVTK